MIQETVERLLPVAPAGKFWIITNDDLRDADPASTPEARSAIRFWPSRPARNTAPAIGLAAFLLERTDPDAVIGMFPVRSRDLRRERSFSRTFSVRRRSRPPARTSSSSGIRPTRRGNRLRLHRSRSGGEGRLAAGHPLHREADLEDAEKFVAAGNFFWNSGMFVWGARTLADALREHLPNTAPLLEQIAASYGTAAFDETFARLYPKCENISIDYAVLEPRSKKGEGKSGILLHPGDVRLERSRLLDRALRASMPANQSWRSQHNLRERKV